MITILRSLLPVLLFLCASAASATERTIIVLDASGSMWAQIDGKPKLEIARQTLRSALQVVPSDAEIGLMAYGHREKNSCDDIELVVPPAKGTASAITSAVDGMKFLGKTPLAAAVKKAAEDLNYTKDKATVILITDGVESCKADPCALGKELEQSGKDFTVHVVGFGLTAEEGKQVGCIAENTGGKYIQATDGKALEDALKATVAVPASAPTATAPAAAPAAPTVAAPSSVVPAPSQTPSATAPAKVEFNLIPETVLKAGGPAFADNSLTYVISKTKPDGTAGDHVSTEYGAWKGNLEPGDYIIASKIDLASQELKLKIEPGKVATPKFNLNAGTLTIRALPAPGAQADRNAQITAEYPGGGNSSAKDGERTFVVPAGETRITVKLGTGEVSETFNLTAGQTISKDIVVGVGHATVNALYATGGEKVGTSNLDIKIYKPAGSADGTRELVTSSFGPTAEVDLPAGDYVAAVQLDATTVEQPLSVKLGERQAVSIVLNAGVLTVTASGASELQILEAKKDAQGERAGVTYGYGQSFQTTLPAGDYVVVSSKGETETETPVTIKAGERKELKVP